VRLARTPSKLGAAGNSRFREALCHSYFWPAGDVSILNASRIIFGQRRWIRNP
jgi:hypothetical protein